MLKVIIAGSRDFNQYETLDAVMTGLLSLYNPNEVEIVSGGAKGADRLGERFARSKGIAIKQFIPDWNGPLGKGAGFARNTEMAKYGEVLVAFTNGSNGTAHMIKQAKALGLTYFVYDFEGNILEEHRAV